ncbi:uncharacterized protein LOC132759899 [Ruditapes philippinarum]|uniref:uncharacterized protein LOC132759899 n=1 Tax=Ruditapes philippinarum TaxID=129788 RepID=UPI00295B3CB9|nr:uncharacterized protein LOC132759899 [Ruditapes philippinarum]
MILTYSLSLNIRNQVTDNIKYPYRQVLPCYECYIQNVAFTHQLIAILTKMVCIQWLHIVLILSGDIHPNPGPSSTNSSTESLSTTSSMSLDLASLMSSGSCLSVLQYNVQSLLSKIEILTTEFSMFDVLAFSETWLNPSVSNSDIYIPCFHAPERNDRVDDSHGGVSLYIKNSLFYKRRMDLEPRNVECVWVEIILSQSKRILVGIFYRPPNADSHYTTLIEHSLNLAEETNIPDIIVTGDFNFNPSTLDEGLEIRIVFFDISKAFDKVWHKGLLVKLKRAGIQGPLLGWFSDYLSNRRQSVVLPGAKSDWSVINAGVPQGSILGPLLFLVYINDIVVDLRSFVNLFADDTSLYLIVDHPVTAADILQSDINKISSWADKWLVKFNPSKSETMLITRKTSKLFHPPLSMQNQTISSVTSHKHLGLHFSDDGSWHIHINHVKERAWKRIHIMRKFKFQLDRKSLEIIYLSYIRPILEYADVVYTNCTQYEKDELDKIQHEASRIVSGVTKLVSIHQLHREVSWESLDSRRKKHKLILVYKMKNGLSPDYLSSLVPPSKDESDSSSNGRERKRNTCILESKDIEYAIINGKCTNQKERLAE